jgi:hypothetical protein
VSVQWAHLGADGVLVASSHGAFIQKAGLAGLGTLGPLGLTRPMPDSQPATEETTRHLLDGAIVAAEQSAPAIDEPPITPRRWAWNLVSQWHCAHHSVALLEDVIERFDAIARPDLAAFARQKLEDELGHDQFALDDLAALGYDANQAVRHVPPAPTVTAGLDYANSCVQGEQPSEFLGYTYALERRVLDLDDDWFTALEAGLPPDVTTGLRKHASELDSDHVEAAITFVAGLPAADRTTIATGCYRTTQICCAWSPDQVPSDAELERWLSRCEVKTKEESVEY